MSPFRSAVPAVLALTLALPAAARAPEPIAPPGLDFQRHVLGNGLVVLLHEDHATPVVAVHVGYHVGSKNEQPGKTGFAHLFEHMMFQGSQHHDDDYFAALEPLGATGLNGTTDPDRTRYFETVPTGALERTLWLEADRMGWLLPAMTDARFENQREVVRNERRQSVDNQPYGTVRERMFAVLYPPNHPYHWDVIGHMDDLERAPKADLEKFFRTYYGPSNATLVLAGDIDPPKALALVEKYFGAIPPGPPVPRMEEWIPRLSGESRLTIQDRVPLPRLYLAWHAPRAWTAQEADLDVLGGVLAQGKTSRLYRKLVYDKQIAQDVSAYHEGREIGGLFWIVVTAKPGKSLDEIEPAVLAEVEALRRKPPTSEEVERVRTGILAGFVRGVERVSGKADRLARYEMFLGDAGWTAKDFARYQAVTPASVRATAERWLHEGRVATRVEPFPALAASRNQQFDRAKAPAVGDPPAARIPVPERAKLSNGLPVMVVRSGKVPVVHVALVLGGGWSADAVSSPPRPGTASFVARMLDEGTKKRDALKLSEEAQRLGASIGAGASLDNVVVSVNALKARLEPSLDLWAEVVREPSFPPAEIERQREQVLGQILQEKKRPASLGLRVMPGLLYGAGHPYAQPLTGSGTEESVRAIAREDLVRFHETWFRANNAALVVVGDTTAQEIVPLLEARLGKGKLEEGKLPALAAPDRPAPEKTVLYLVDRPGAAQSLVLAGQLLPRRSELPSVPFDVLNTVLGGQFTSRLNMNLREQHGWTYGASSFAVDARGPAMFMAFSEVRTDVTKDALAEVLKELRDLREARPPAPAELERAQDNLVLSLPGQYETAGGVASRLVESVALGLPDDYWQQYPDRVRAETPASQAALAKALLRPERLVLVVVGDRAAVEPGLAALGLGRIELLDVDGRPLPGTAGK